MSIRFNKDAGIGKVLLEWWERLEEDRASRAILRRATSVTAVTLTPPYQRLHQRLLSAGWPKEAKPYQNDRLAAVVGLLAHVAENDESRSPAEAMSPEDAGQERPPVSELRFMRLLESPDIETLFAGLRRALPLVKHRVGVLALANDVIHWGDGVKKNWAYSYKWPEKSKR